MAGVSSMTSVSYTHLSHWESIIGRSPSSDIVIYMPSVSKLHASLQRDGDGDWTLSDLRSRDGTYINGDEIDILEPVEDGDLSLIHI